MRKSLHLLFDVLLERLGSEALTKMAISLNAQDETSAKIWLKQIKNREKTRRRLQRRNLMKIVPDGESSVIYKRKMGASSVVSTQASTLTRQHSTITNANSIFSLIESEYSAAHSDETVSVILLLFYYKIYANFLN